MNTPVRHKLLFLCVPVLCALISWSSILRHARDNVSDLLFGFRKAPENILLITIDEQSIQAVGQWPWPREVIGRAITRLAPASAIGIDVNFKEPSRLGVADDLALAGAMRASRVPVVIASDLQPNGTVINPIPVLASASLTGLANLAIDPDGTARSIQIWRADKPVLAVQIAQAAGYETLRRTGLQRIRYLGPENSVPSYPFIDLLNGRIPASELKDKIILIGATARDLQDIRQTPLGLISGVEIQANIVDNVIHDDFLRSNPLVDVLLTFAAGLAGLVLTLAIRRAWIIILGLIAIIGIVWISVFIAFDSGLLTDLLMPTIAILAGSGTALTARYMAAAQERRFIHDTFSRYLAPQVIQALMEDPSLVRLGGERRNLTILFSDIRGFTSLSETMGPQELSHFLNRYLTRMTDVILERQGVIDKYIGDAVMSFWGAPLDDDRHALNGIRSALAMVKALEEFNQDNEILRLPRIDIGIGLNTGAVTVGNMGSEKRFDYTVIGDDVNLASRLESLTKTYGVHIIVSDTVLTHVAPSERNELHTREIDRVRVKGKSQPVTIHEVMSPSQAKRLAPHLELFSAARDHYYAGRWTLAEAALDQFIAAARHDGPAQLLKERTLSFQENPPADWQGIYEMTSK
jgi:adenylate cyclase